MTTRAGSGHIERQGRAWYLRRRATVTDQVSGTSRQEQVRVRLGSTREIRSAVAARKIADAYLARLAAPTLEPGLAVTFGEYSERFIRDHVALLREGSRRRYTSSIKRLQACLGSESLSAIDAPRLQQAITELSKDRAPATVKTFRAIALQILRRARVDRFGAHVIDAKDIKLPRQSKPAAVRLSFSQAELERIIAGSYPPWSVLWGVMGYAGLRVGEALALTWADVDLDAESLQIRANITRAGRDAPKTASSAASTPMLPRLAELLREYRPLWRTNGAGLLFSSRTGRPLSADNLRARKLKPLLERLGLPRAGHHAFRHSTPGILAELGLAHEPIRQLMRHSSLAMTAKYLHFSRDQVRAAIGQAIGRRAAVQTSAEGPQP